MGFKEKIIGLILLIFGAWPFLLKIEQVAAFFSKDVLEWLVPGEIIYQIAIMVLGAMLIWRVKPKVEHTR
ncbi:MAG: hypothetical protein ACOCUI_04590 [bacterium]